MPATVGTGDRTKVFVLGNQKAGTTMVAASLALVAGRTVTLGLPGEDEQPSFHRAFWGVLPFASFVNANAAAFASEVIRDSHLTPLYQRVAAHFPEARFCFVVRDPRKNIQSILGYLGLSGRECDWRALARLSPAWQLVLDGRWMGLSGDSYVEVLAQHWVRLVDVYLGARPHISLVRYEAFQADPHGAIARAAAALGLPASAPLTRPPRVRPRRPVRPHPPVGEHFGANLDVITAICGERMRSLGYELE